MILLVDIGNSNIVFGLSDGTNILKSYRLKSFLDKTNDEFYILFKNVCSDTFDDVIISSVVPVVTSALTKMFQKYYNISPLILGPGIKTGVMLKADDPKSVGADLISDVAGAMNYSNEAIIVDMGTATKFIYAKDYVFHGVSIAPGVAVSMKALIKNAALLPEIELQTPSQVLGKNTISCLQSGIIYGSAAMVDGMIYRIKKELKKDDIKVIMTGGLSKIIAPLVEIPVLLVPDLNLEGLLQIYKKNRK